LGSRHNKHKVLALLNGRDLVVVLEELRQFAAKDAVNALFSAICREDPHVRWFAISCMGEAVARLAAVEMEEARIVMRRFLWSLNDESGGIGWGVPESMAEVMCRHAGLAEEYVHMLISYMREDGEEICQDGNYIEHPLLQRGLLWGAARLSECRPDLLLAKGVAADIPPYLESEDPATRGLAALAAGHLQIKAAGLVLRRLTGDPAGVSLYRDGVFIETTVGSLAQSALEAMQQ
jgi:hypothetical protein